MGLSIGGVYDLDIVINGESVDWTQMQLDGIKIVESCKQMYAVGEITFACTDHYVLVNPPTDGSTVYITVTDNQTPTPATSVFNMTVFNSRMMSRAGSFYYYLSLRVDADDLYKAKIKSYGETSSSNAIAQAASDAGLSPSVDASSDVQKWLRTNERGAEFIHDTAAHSWAGAVSCFVTAILANQTLRHYNVTQRAGSGGQWTFLNRISENYTPSGNEILYDDEDCYFETISGSLNTVAGYGNTTGEYDLSKGFNNIKSDVAQMFSGALNMAKGMMGSQKAVTAPFKSDNHHENYNLAATQNLRLKSLYSTRISIMSRYPKNAQVLDSATLIPYGMAIGDSGGIISPYAGDYYVSEVITLVKPTEITKNYLLLSQGTSDSGGGE